MTKFKLKKHGEFQLNLHKVENRNLQTATRALNITNKAIMAREGWCYGEHVVKDLAKELITNHNRGQYEQAV